MHKTRVFSFSPSNITNYLFALSLHTGFRLQGNRKRNTVPFFKQMKRRDPSAFYHHSSTNLQQHNNMIPHSFSLRYPLGLSQHSSFHSGCQNMKSHFTTSHRGKGKSVDGIGVSHDHLNAGLKNISERSGNTMDYGK